MYEYRTQLAAGPIPPTTLTPPEDGFRLRDMKYVETSRYASHMTSKEFSGSGVIPYTASVTESVTGTWIIIWERYVPQQEKE